MPYNIKLHVNKLLLAYNTTFNIFYYLSFLISGVFFVCIW